MNVEESILAIDECDIFSDLFFIRKNFEVDKILEKLLSFKGKIVLFGRNSFVLPKSYEQKADIYELCLPTIEHARSICYASGKLFKDKESIQKISLRVIEHLENSIDIQLTPLMIQLIVLASDKDKTIAKRGFSEADYIINLIIKCLIVSTGAIKPHNKKSLHDLNLLSMIEKVLGKSNAQLFFQYASSMESVSGSKVKNLVQGISFDGHSSFSLNPIIKPHIKIKSPFNDSYYFGSFLCEEIQTFCAGYFEAFQQSLVSTSRSNKLPES